MPLSDKIMNIFKKITIKSPKTNQDIKLSSALTSDDPMTKKVGVKKAKDIIQKAKDSKPKDKLSPELQKVKDDAIEKANQLKKDNPIMAQPIQTRQGVFYPGERQHYHQTGFDPYGEYAVQIAKTGNYDAPTPEDSKTQVDGDGSDDSKMDKKEATQYVKENKEEVLKYVIKKIIKEE